MRAPILRHSERLLAFIADDGAWVLASPCRLTLAVFTWLLSIQFGPWDPSPPPPGVRCHASFLLQSAEWQHFHWAIVSLPATKPPTMMNVPCYLFNQKGISIDNYYLINIIYENRKSDIPFSCSNPFTTCYLFGDDDRPLTPWSCLSAVEAAMILRLPQSASTFMWGTLHRLCLLQNLPNEGRFWHQMASYTSLEKTRQCEGSYRLLARL